LKWTVAVLFLAIASEVLAMSPDGMKDQLMKIKLSAPETQALREYLGLGDEPDFTIDRIDAKVVIIEIFSMYCPHCQREAPIINRFYDLLRKNKKTGSDFKLIGIGVGNSSFEVDHFRTTYGISFPLFADGEFKLHKALGEVGTPHFICLARSKNGSWSVILSRSGGIKDPEAFLSTILEQTENVR